MAHSHIVSGAESNAAQPVIRKIGISDLRDALSRGVDDFSAMPTHAVFLCLIYPIVGLVLFRLAVGYDVLPLLFPLAAGFALLGPLAAVGLYELSRRREAGLDTNWSHALDVFRSSSLGAIAALGGLLLVIFLVWLAVAQAIYTSYFGYEPAASIPDFVEKVLTTSEGWQMMLVGNAAGLLFAVVVLVLTAVSFPLLLDRDVGAAAAVSTSIRAFAKNPVTMMMWGIIVAALLVLGSLPLFMGLTVAVPVLGHATWHLYRKVVDSGDAPRPTYRTDPEGRRYAADFPANLFPWSREK
jgi:uncharacterized membrane protein